jgi:S1-C subfamily serine protease
VNRSPFCPPILAPVLLAILAPGPGAIAGETTDASLEAAATVLDLLRDLERRAAAAIDAAREAFVFIDGGSGFLIEGSLVLTNEHVVAGKSRMVVQLLGGRTFRAEVLGHDPEGDVALLKLEGDPGVKHLELGDSDQLRVGEHVVAIGDPFLVASRNLFLSLAPPDYDPSASLGIVSALHRFSDMYTDAIQVDVAVNRGNSGGPLLTLDGKVVGINGKIETRFAFGINTGVGYAVPSNQIKRFLAPLKSAKGGFVRHGAIHGLDVAERADGAPGLPVVRVRRGSPAESMGFEAGDKVLAIDGEPIISRSRYLGVLGTYPSGHEVTVRVERRGEPVEIRVGLLEAGGVPYLGMKTQVLQGEDGAPTGVMVIEVIGGSPAERAGLQVNDRILSVGGRKVESTVDVRAAIQDRVVGDEVPLAVLRDGKELELKVRLGGRRGS